jgi:hypothetical protein
MKDQAQAAMQSSGYPLTIVEPPKTKTFLPVLPADAQTTSIQKNQISNDPGNWDVNWFNGYE